MKGGWIAVIVQVITTLLRLSTNPIAILSRITSERVVRSVETGRDRSPRRFAVDRRAVRHDVTRCDVKAFVRQRF